MREYEITSDGLQIGERLQAIMVSSPEFRTLNPLVRDAKRLPISRT